MLLLGMVILSLSSVSALELNPFADKKIYEPILKEDVSDFIKQDFNEQYGVIKLSKTFFWIETDKIAEYSLIENTEQCLINCEARGKAVLYSPGKLFDDLNFIDKRGLSLDINAKYLIKTIETYEVEVPDTYKEVCEKVASNLTKGDYENSCYEIVDSYKKETRENEVWVEYKGEELKAGEYEWKVQGTKSPTKAIDFIPTARGKAFNEWAWWNGDWQFKREINLSTSSGYTSTNYSIRLNVSYSANMKSDFADLRFINGSENAELGYWINTTGTSNGNYADVYVRVPENITTSNLSIYMYYGNPSATTTSSCPSAFLFCDLADSDNSASWLKNSEPSGQNTGATPSLSWGSGEYTITITENRGGWVYAPINITSDKIEILVDMKNQGALNPQPGLGLRRDTAFATGTNYGQFVTYNLWNYSTSSLSAIGTSGSGGTTTTSTYQLNRYIVQFDSNTQNSSLTPTDNFNRNATSKVFYGNPGIYFFQNGGSNAMQFKNFLVKRFSSNVPTAYFGEEIIVEGVSVALSSPINAFNSSSQTIDFNATITPTSADLINVTFRAGAIEETNSISGNESLVYNWTKTFADGDYSWNITACGEGESTSILCSTTASRNFTIDTIPPSLTLNAPLTNFTTLTLPINVTLNFTATDSHLSSCWYGYNGTNTTFTCNTNQTINITTSGAHSINYYANDTLGNEANGTAPFYVYHVTRNATATNPITEGGISSHSFYLNMTNIASFNATAELYWNGTSYGLGTKTTLSNDSLRFDKNIIVPSINGTSVNWTWVYNISGNPNVTNYDLNGSQTYIKVNITECGAGTYRILNYTMYDQETRALGSTVNASIEIDLTLTSQANTSLNWQYHATKSSSTSFLICLPSGALNNSAYNLDSIAKYSYQDHVIQYHYIEKFNLTNSTIPQTIRLYPLATAKSTSFLVNYQDENYIYVENAVIDVWRRYVGDGVFFSVEHGKTDANGQTRLHLVTEDIIYKFLVWQNGELVYTSPEFLALCQATPCQINLRKSISDQDGFSERDNIIYDYSFNKETRTASFTFATKDNTQTEINMTILSSNQYANETACSTTLTTSGGQIDCIIPTAFTNTSYQTIITKDGKYFGTAFDSLAPNSIEIFGYTGLILTAIAFLMLALMGISSGIATIIFGILGLAFMGLVQIFESGSAIGIGSAIIWLIVGGVIIIIKITKRRIQ